jgi:hypothetical protein
VARFIHELFPDADGVNFQGSLSISGVKAEDRIAAAAIQAGSTDEGSIGFPVVGLDPEATERTLYFAEYARGGEWSSRLLLANPSSATIAEVSTLDEKGRPVSWGDEKEKDGVVLAIPSRGGAILTTEKKDEFISGTARVSGDGPIAGTLRIESPEIGTWSVGASLPMPGFIVPVTRSVSGRWSTGVAIASVGSEENLTLVLRDESGVEVSGGEATLVLGPNEQASRQLEELFPEAETQEFRGTLTVTAEGGEIIGSALRIGTNPGNVAALPVKELK